MEGLYCERTLYRRQRAQARIRALELLHDEPICGVAETRAAVSFQIRSIETQRAHTRDEMFGELAGAMARNDLGQNLLLHKTPRPIARSAFFLSEKLFDAVVVQRGQIKESARHGRSLTITQRKHNASSMRPVTQRSAQCSTAPISLLANLRLSRL